jgi:hypothetical protein
MILTHNPAKGAIEKQRKIIRDQYDRLRFEKTDLDKYFLLNGFQPALVNVTSIDVFISAAPTFTGYRCSRFIQELG